MTAGNRSLRQMTQNKMDDYFENFHTLFYGLAYPLFMFTPSQGINSCMLTDLQSPLSGILYLNTRQY